MADNRIDGARPGTCGPTDYSNDPVANTDEKKEPCDASAQSCAPADGVGGVSYQALAQAMPKKDVAPVPDDSPYFGLSNEDLAKRKRELEEALSVPADYKGKDKDQKELADINAIQKYRASLKQPPPPPKPCDLKIDVAAVRIPALKLGTIEVSPSVAVLNVKADLCTGVDVSVSVVHASSTHQVGPVKVDTSLDIGSAHAVAAFGDKKGPDGSDGVAVGASATLIGGEATFTAPKGTSITAGAAYGVGSEGGHGTKKSSNGNDLMCGRAVTGPVIAGGCAPPNK